MRICCVLQSQGRMEERKEVWALFPAGWRVPQTLCLTFCKVRPWWCHQG